MFNSIKALFSSDDTKAKIARNVAWSVVGKVVNLSSALFVGILVARYLGPAQYGVMNYAISIVTLFSIISSFGMDGIVIRELTKNPENKDSILGSVLITRICLAIFALSLVVAYLFFCNESFETNTLILIYSTTLLFSSFDVIRAYFISIIQNEYIVKSEISRTLIAATLQIILLVMKAPLYAFIIVLALNFMFLASGYILAYTRKVGSIFSWKFDKNTALFILKTSFPILLASASAVVYQRIDQVMIANMIDDAALGYFATAMSFSSVLIFIPDMAMQTLAPLLVKYYSENKELYEKRSFAINGILTWVMFSLSIIISLLAYPIIYFTYGIEYILAVPVLQILSFKLVGVANSTVGGNLTIIENIHKYAAIRNVIACVVCVVLNYLMIPRWGIIGSAWASLITIIFQGWLANIFIPQYHHIFRKQTYAMLFGWRYIINYKDYLK